MGSFPGHALPGTFFILFGLWFAVKECYRYFVKARKVTKWYKNADLLEGIIKVFFTAIGILMEQVTSNGPEFQLHSKSDPQEFQDGNNWAHCTMYIFFLYTGVADIFAYKFPKLTPKGLPSLMLGLAFFIEGFLFYFHTSGREGIDVRVHVLLVISTFVGGAGMSLAGVIDTLQPQDPLHKPYNQKHEHNNGYLQLETMEGSLLDNNENNDNEHNFDEPKIKNHSNSTELNQVLKLLENNLKQEESSELNKYKNLRYILVMISTVSTILQGTWFWQIAFTLYPPGKPGWDEKSHSNMTFITMFYTWHLSIIILLVSIIHGVMYFCVRRKQTNYNEI